MQLTTLNGNGTNNKVHKTQQVQIPDSLEYRPEDVPNTDIVQGLKLPPLSLKLNRREKPQQKPHIKVATCKVKANSICKYAKKLPTQL